MPLLLGLVIFSRNPPILPLMLMRAFTILVVTPAVAVWLIERAVAATLRVEGTALVIDQRERRVDIPVAAISRIDSWVIPLPGAGLWLRLRSGRRFGLRVGDPVACAEWLAGAIGLDATAPALTHPTAVYAHLKQRVPRRWWSRPAFKFGVFSLVPTLPLFRVHQYIAYGGAFGQYYLQGLGPYLQRFALYWSTLILYLILYAALWRGIAELTAYAAAWVAPSRAARVRQAVEIGCQLLYYAAVPILLILWFLPW